MEEREPGMGARVEGAFAFDSREVREVDVRVLPEHELDELAEYLEPVSGTEAVDHLVGTPEALSRQGEVSSGRVDVSQIEQAERPRRDGADAVPKLDEPGADFLGLDERTVLRDEIADDHAEP